MVFATTAYAVNPVTWNVALSTTGQDVFWTSPTALTLGFPEYDWSYEITRLDARVLFSNVDLLDQLESTTGSGTTSTLPAVIVDESLSEPTTNSSADIRIEVDAAGFGRASGTNIVLGSVGFLRIQRVDLEATISVIGMPDGDYNRDGEVTLADYDLWKSDFGSIANLNADGNDNNVVDAADYAIWRDAFSLSAGAGAAMAVPEPAFIAHLVMAIAVVAVSRRRVLSTLPVGRLTFGTARGDSLRCQSLAPR
jgi:hypothetical protein